MSTIIQSQLAVDPAFQMDANYQFSRVDRRYIDDQILAIEQLIVDNLINGKTGSWFTLSGSSAAVIEGDTVCLAASGGAFVTKATATALVAAGSVVGLVVRAASPGAKVLVALAGIVPPSITTLGVTGGVVYVDPATSRCTYTQTSYIIGTAPATGWLNIAPTMATSVGTLTSTFIIRGEVQTTDATATTIVFYDMLDESLCTYDLIVTAARRTNVTKGGRWKRSVTYRRTSAGVATIVGALDSGTDQETDAGLNVTLATNAANQVRAQVVGIAATNFNWSAELRVQQTIAT